MIRPVSVIVRRSLLTATVIAAVAGSLVPHVGPPVTLHIDNLRGDNAHHQCETVFKAFARALRAAVEPDPRLGGRLPSTKESL
mgnify:CR=1 FL=1